MNSRQQRKILILNLSFAAIIITAAMFLLEVTGAAPLNYEVAGDGVDLMSGVYTHVLNDYIEAVNPDEVSKNAVKGILDNLDPYSAFLPPIDYNQLMEDSKGEFGGLGIEIQRVGDYPRIMSYPLPDTPAERAHLRAGDEIVDIDGVSTEGMDINDVVAKLRGKIGTKVNIKVKRPGREDLLSFEIIRATIPLKNIPYYGEIEKGIGYIQLVRFNREASHEMEEALVTLQNIENLKGIILDLRGNPGGLLPAAQQVADKFLARGSDIVFTQGRDPDNRLYLRAEHPPTLHPSVPLVVLVNRASASASEIVAGAIQDHDRGVLIGVTTFGKGSVQTVFEDLPNRAGIKLTTAYYYTPSKRNIHNKRNFDEDYLRSQIFDEEGTPASEDSLSKQDKYYTLNKERVVYGGGGIAPDIIVKVKPFGNIMLQLLSQGVFYDFTIEYLAKHPDIGTDFRISDAVIDEFKAYIANEDVFKYSIPGKRILDEFKKTVKREKYNGDIVTKVSNLEQALLDKRDDDFETNREHIKRILKREIMVSKFGSRERAIAAKEWDIQLQKSIEVLNDTDRYNKALAFGVETGVIDE